MKKLALCTCLLVIAGIGTMGTNACSSSSGTGSNSGSDSGGDDSSAESGSSSGGTEDSSGSSSGSSGSSSGGSDSGPGVDASACRPGPAGDAAFSCPANEAGMSPPAPDMGSMACDLCVEGCCGDSYCACAGDSQGGDGGQPMGCFGFVACVRECVFPATDSGMDGGTLLQCGTLCSPAFSPQQIMEGRALLGCLTESCATSTTCPSL